MTRIKIYKDSSEDTWGYNILNEEEDSVLMGDGYESPDSIVKDLTELRDHLSDAINNIPELHNSES